tara:strand:+ start:222 stop:479 length:258 start_codon:yes stop_codon:yes gene_type:complete
MKKLLALLEEVQEEARKEVLEAELEARAEADVLEVPVARSNTTAEKLLFRLHFTALMIEAGRMRAANKSFSKAQDFCRELIDQGH